MVFAEIVSPNCWFSEQEGALLLPYPEALTSELVGQQKMHAVGFLLDLGKEHPALYRVCSDSKDEMSRYVTTGKWGKETTFSAVDPTKADLEGVLWFAGDLTRARKKIPEPYATHLANFMAELVAYGLKIS